MRRSRFWLASAGAFALGLTVLGLPSMAAAQSICGPTILAGHDADDHGFDAVYAGLFDQILANVSNGGSGILAIGADPGLEAGTWIQSVASLMTIPQTVTFVNGTDITTQSFAGFAILHVPSDSDDTQGGISQAENDLLGDRASDVAAFVNGGGGLFGLTQGQFTDAWKYVSDAFPLETVDVPPSGSLPSGDSFDDVTSTPDGQLLGITDSNLDGCCFHNIFITFPSFLKVLAIANAPNDPDYHGEAVFIGGFSTCLLPFCGDGTVDPGEACDDGNNVDGDGCSAVCTLECPNAPPSIVCKTPLVCNDPGACAASVSCDAIAAVCDPEGDALTVSCDNPGPFPVGTSTVVVTASDGTTSVEQTCSLGVRDCEPPSCIPPAELDLECSASCGVAGDDPAVLALLAGVTAADNCAVDSVRAIAPPLYASGCGASARTPVGFVVTDTAGYERSCESAVGVKDTTAPTLAGCDLRILALPCAPALPTSPASPASPSSPVSPASFAPSARTPPASSLATLVASIASAFAPRDPEPLVEIQLLAPPSAPRAAASASSACSAANSAAFAIVECGAAADACDGNPELSAQLVLTRHEVQGGSCVEIVDVVDVACGEPLILLRLDPVCPLAPPLEPPPPPVWTDPSGVRVMSAESIRLEVRASDRCGHVSDACTRDAADVPGPFQCLPPPPACGAPLCGVP